jgi:[acyl-carrier-protein] S-malonyltransferase
METVLLFPGQGSHQPGMGRDLYDAYPEARAAFDAVDDAIGSALSRLCFEGPADTLTLTHNAQPALLAHGAALWAVLRARSEPRTLAAAGHSLGEFTAYHAAGSLTLADSARVVRRRGELMYQAGMDRPGAMAALLGELSEPVESLCERASEAGIVVPANYNSPQQVVISGEVAGVERAMELAKDVGAKRATRLNVSGAFHSPLMAPAAGGLRVVLEGVELAAPRFPVWSNVTGAPVTMASDAADLLLRQLTAPVKWVTIMRGLAAAHPEALFIELGPGNVLSGLAKRIVPDVTVTPCATASDVATILERIA